MKSGFVNTCFGDSKRKPIWWRGLAVASLAALITAGDHVAAASGRYEQGAVESRAAGEPIMAIVSLREQRITVYDARGWILRAPVSSGQKGRETPAGIFSVLEKEAEHYSNLYDDAYMPHMQRITWSGIALHGGPLPGYPASHGCIRMPYDFAARLFDVTKPGMRVIVAPREVAPIEIAHPALFQSKPGAGAVAAATAAAADEAATKAEQARLAAVTASREAAQAAKLVRTAENLKLRAEAQLAATERALASAGSAEAKEQAENAKAKAAAKAAELEAQLVAAKAEQQPQLDALASAREAAVAAEAARVVAAQAAREAARGLEPVSVFISRKTQRLYVRQAFQPILESPVTIQDVDRPIGTHVFTAMERAGGEADMRWSVVSLDGGEKEALERITIPQDALDRIAGMVSPRSSVIISDEALSSETGKGTEFVVLMSGEPQGGIKFRRHGPETVRYERSRDRLPFWRSPYFFW
ncbi:MAG TPA: L,D-transpeptidase family protein [Xanthobacteraceae bacterium]